MSDNLNSISWAVDLDPLAEEHLDYNHTYAISKSTDHFNNVPPTLFSPWARTSWQSPLWMSPSDTRKYQITSGARAQLVKVEVVAETNLIRFQFGFFLGLWIIQYFNTVKYLYRGDTERVWGDYWDAWDPVIYLFSSQVKGCHREVNFRVKTPSSTSCRWWTQR
jgi:hypothetical protein